ncbi:MAG: hypothetical protein V4683_14070 [Bacteroidota bacterium]
METIKIEIVNPKAMNLLRDMEDLKVIKILNSKPIINRDSITKLKGSISKQEADEFNEFVNKSREEWETIF